MSQADIGNRIFERMKAGARRPGAEKHDNENVPPQPHLLHQSTDPAYSQLALAGPLASVR